LKHIFTPLALCAASTAAAEPVNQEQLSMLITGNTLYVTVPAGTPGAPDGSVAPIFYGTDGSAVAQLPDGPKLIGDWKMADTGYCIDWDNGPKNSCSSISREAEGFAITDVKTGVPRGQVFTIATGNAENL